MKTHFILAAALAAIVAGLGAQPTGNDWPQWRGPDRTGVSRETGLLQEWPSGGPPIVWSITGLGSGYGGVSTKDGRLFVQGMRGRMSLVHSINIADGAYNWSKNIGQATSNDRGPGPRGTPTLDGDRLYVLTESGDLACLLSSDATMIWQRNILRDFGARNIQWLISESPLIDGDRVIVTPGGRSAGMVALDKMTGKTIWVAKDLSDEAGYSSAVVADVGGIRAYTTVTGAAAVGVRASDGKLLWRYPAPANNTANIATPIVEGHQAFYTSNYGTGAGLLNLRAEGDGIRAQEGYFTRDMQNHHGGVVLVGGTLYGFNAAILTALEFASGKMLWRDRSVGKGAVAYADNRLYILSENNVVGLAEVTPSGYRETGRFEIPDQGLPSWAHPVVSNKRLYLRNQGTLTAFDVRAR